MKKQIILPTSFKIRPRAIARLEKGKPLTVSMSKRIYKKYIKSPEWTAKKAIYKKDYCEICGTKFLLNLHHASYKSVTQETADDFITLCRYCHLACHIGVADDNRLKHPSRAGWKIANRMRNHLKLKRDATAIFLRRRYIAKYGTHDLPELDVFRTYFYENIYSRKFPFDLAIAKL